MIDGGRFLFLFRFSFLQLQLPLLFFCVFCNFFAVSSQQVLQGLLGHAKTAPPRRQIAGLCPLSIADVDIFQLDAEGEVGREVVEGVEEFLIPLEGECPGAPFPCTG